MRKQDNKKNINRIIELAKEARKELPRSGCKKVLDDIKPKLMEEQIKIGENKFINMMGEVGMHIERKKKQTRTTYSKHEYAVAPNLIKNLEVIVPNKVFISDITYIRLRREFGYLFLVTDLFSRRIVGYDFRQDLKHDGALNALKISLSRLESSKGIIHHSDRGCQYCCHEFLNEIKKNEMLASMTDEGHCYQNAVAERVNGILKDEFYLDVTFNTFEQAKRAMENAIYLYNNRRKHWSLNLETPEAVYRRAV